MTGLKIIGKPHVDKILSDVINGSSLKDKRLAELIAGFDMVNEEDFTKPISYFAEDILKGKAQMKELGLNGMQCFFHAGETHDRNRYNVHDAILLNTKRLGHGF